MGIKKKIILMGICVCIMLAILILNIIRGMKDPGESSEEFITRKNAISRVESYRLLSFLNYGKEERDTLSMGITYTDSNMSGWYDPYINAVWKMGLIDGQIEKHPRGGLTYGECKALIDRLILSTPIYQGIYEQLSFDFIHSDQEMLISEFLQLYTGLISIQPQEKQRVQEKTLFVLGQDTSYDGKGLIVTDQGKYYYSGSRNYQETDTYGQEITQEIIEQKYMDMGIRAMVSGQEMIYITEGVSERVVLHNVWIKNGSDLTVETYIYGIHKSFQAKNRLSADIAEVIGDISLEEGRIVGISVKPDIINGKVLQSGKDYIEVEGYGKLLLDENYKIYKLYGELSIEETNSILVGYETTDFVVSGGKISAALIRESIRAENIRVLINTNGYKDIYHENIEFTGTTAYTVKSGEMETEYEAGENIVLKPGDPMLSNGRIIIQPKSEKGRIQILSIERFAGKPKYRGRIEIVESEKGLLIVNELPLEEYLYAVIPSEMPTYYGLEALKVQAVCARSYAYRHLMANSLSNYGAHVDDSVAYQVYNNIEENENSILAVKDTYGKVIRYEGEVIEAFYFSTSCGHTTGAENVWSGGQTIPYLPGRLMTVENPGGEVTVSTENQKKYENLTKEDNFRSFIMDTEYPTYDSGFQWYRWNTTIPVKEVETNINQKLAGRYQANPNLIQTLTYGSEEDGDAVYESMPVENIGNLVDIKVIKRGRGGIILELQIVGSKKTIKVSTEYNIRALLAPVNSVLTRLDDSKVDGLNLLPSAFFVIDQEMSAEGKIKNITLHGGGYGHGVGMSQNGVKSLVESGKEYEDIIKYFYQGTQLGYIYD